MARANYANVRRYLAKRFDVSRSYTGRGGRGNLTPGAKVRTTYNGVLVDYVVGSTAFNPDGADAKLEEIRVYLSEKFTVADYAPGRLIVTDKD